MPPNLHRFTIHHWGKGLDFFRSPKFLLPRRLQCFQTTQERVNPTQPLLDQCSFPLKKGKLRALVVAAGVPYRISVAIHYESAQSP